MSKNILFFIFSYLILSLYFYLIPLVYLMNDILRFFHLVLFFPIAFLLARKKGGLKSYGLVYFTGWKRNLFIGFAIGFISFSFLYLFRFILGSYEFIGLRPVWGSIMTLIVVFVGFGLGSLINDIIVRGLVFNFFKDRVPLVKLMVIAILLYALDDIWLEGFSINNTIFSIVLGLSLTYAFYTTNSIWANTGIHVGLNVVYGLFYGVSGKVGDGVFLFDVNEKANGFFSSYLSIIIACIMFLMVYRFLPVLTSVSSETDNRAGFLNKNA